MVFGWNLDYFLVRAYKTTGIVNLKIQEEAISPSCLMLATPSSPSISTVHDNNFVMGMYRAAGRI